MTAENARVKAEQARVTAENKRQENENTRIQQEQQRQQDTSQAVKNTNEATDASQKATTACKEVTERAEDALQNQEQLEATLNTATQIRQDVSQMQTAVAEAKKQVEQDKRILTTRFKIPCLHPQRKSLRVCRTISTVPRLYIRACILIVTAKHRICEQ